jgi:hypothetical protein
MIAGLIDRVRARALPPDAMLPWKRAARVVIECNGELAPKVVAKQANCSLEVAEHLLHAHNWLFPALLDHLLETLPEAARAKAEKQIAQQGVRAIAERTGLPLPLAQRVRAKARARNRRIRAQRKASQ